MGVEGVRRDEIFTRVSLGPWGLQNQVGLSWLKGTLHGKE